MAGADGDGQSVQTGLFDELDGLVGVGDMLQTRAAAAMDQRGSLQKSLAKEKGSAVSDAMMEEFKILVS
ncbi:MAG: hypothetical protein WCB94_02090, partial [Terriglobales bacterium]